MHCETKHPFLVIFMCILLRFDLFTLFILCILKHKQLSKSNNSRPPSPHSRRTSHFTAHLPHLLGGEVLAGSREELGHEGLYGPHHGAETVDAEQHGGANPAGAARPAAPANVLPAPAETHGSPPAASGELAGEIASERASSSGPA